MPSSWHEHRRIFEPVDFVNFGGFVPTHTIYTARARVAALARRRPMDDVELGTARVRLREARLVKSIEEQLMTISMAHGLRDRIVDLILSNTLSAGPT